MRVINVLLLLIVTVTSSSNGNEEVKNESQPIDRKIELETINDRRNWLTSDYHASSDSTIEKFTTAHLQTNDDVSSITELAPSTAVPTRTNQNTTTTVDSAPSNGNESWRFWWSMWQCFLDFMYQMDQIIFDFLYNYDEDFFEEYEANYDNYDDDYYYDGEYYYDGSHNFDGLFNYEGLYY